MSHTEHREAAASRAVRCAVITCSDTRTPETDSSGDLIADRLHAAGHEVALRRLTRESPEDIAAAFDAACGAAEAVIMTGGTGLSSRDGTIEIVRPTLNRELPGFGELFRMLSHREIGAAAMLSRAIAGARGRTLVFCLPGSAAAVRLAMDELILPELSHLIREIER